MPSRIHSAPAMIVWAAAAALALLSWWLLTATFMVYDDEGYVLHSLQAVAAGHPLYTEVFSQYGPFPYVLHLLLGRAGYPFTSDAVRMLTGICWLGTAAGAGLITRDLTGSRRLGLAGMLLAWVALSDMRSEPGHPGGLLALLTVAAAWGGTRQITRNRWTAFGGWQSGLGTLMLLSKINVGIFHLCGSMLWWPLHAPGLGRKVRRMLLASLPVILATGLMRGLLHEPAVQAQLALFACMMVPLAWCQPGPVEGTAGHRVVGIAGGVMAAVIVLTGLVVWAGGTSLRDLFHYTIVAPLQQPTVYHHFIPWQPLTWLAGVGSVLGMVAWLTATGTIRRTILRGLKCAALLGLAWGCAQAEIGRVEVALYQWVAPLGWALAMPLRDNIPAGQIRARWWLAWLLGWHWLQAYPVAGTQVAWGGFLAVPLVLVALQDLGTTARSRLTGHWLALLLAFLAVTKVGGYAWRYQQEGAPLNLPGATSLRLQPRLASTLRTVATNVTANAGMLFTYPGMLSLNQWTGVPPPTHANTTHWFSLLNANQQAAIRRRLEQTGDSLVVVQREHVQYLIQMDLAPGGPLKDYLQANYRPVLRIDGYDIWSRQPERFVPQSVARALDVSGRLTVVLWTHVAMDEIETIVVTDPANATTPLRFHPAGEALSPAPWPGRDVAPTRSAQRYCWWPGTDADWVRRPVVELRLLDRTGKERDRLRLEHSPLIAPAFTDALPPSTD